MDEDDRCPRCGLPAVPDPPELDAERVDIDAALEGRGERRDWVYLADVEELLYGDVPEATIDPADELAVQIFGELDEAMVRRESIRKLLRLLGWEHVPLRSLVDERGSPRELWCRTQTLRELDEATDKKSRREHELVTVLSEYVGMERRHERMTLAATDYRRRQRDDVLALLRETGRPMWTGEIAQALAIKSSTVTHLVARLVGEGSVVRFRHERKADATYCHVECAESFRHIPVKEILPVDDEQEIDLYEEVARIVAGATGVREHRIFGALPNVRNPTIRSVLHEMGWRPRRVQAQRWWVSPEHPQYTPRKHATRAIEEQIAARRATYRPPEGDAPEPESPEGYEEAFVETVEALDPGGDEARVLAVLREGGLAPAREIARGAELSTRTTTRILRALVEAGRVKSFPMGAAEGFVAL